MDRRKVRDEPVVPLSEFRERLGDTLKYLSNGERTFDRSELRRRYTEINELLGKLHHTVLSMQLKDAAKRVEQEASSLHASDVNDRDQYLLRQLAFGLWCVVESVGMPARRQRP